MAEDKPKSELAVIAEAMGATVDARLDAARAEAGEAHTAATAGGRKRRRGGSWQPGQSGNPAGKKPGTRNRATLIAEQLMAGDVEAVTKSVLAAAMSGDMQAARLILDRVAPVRKGRPVEFELPAIDTASDVAAATGAIALAVAGGELTPEEGQAVAGILEVRRKAIETVDHESRLAALEAQQKGRAA